MNRLDRPSVVIDLSRIVANVDRIKERTRRRLIAVIKSDAYGLGARDVVGAIADHVDGFYCFSLKEAIEAGTAATGKPAIALLGPTDATALDYRQHSVHPAVWDVERARSLAPARPVLVVDTGMQRFACAPDQIDAILAAGACDQAFTHATQVEQALRLAQLCAGRSLLLHAAASSLLDEPRAWLDAVRPGLALFRDAVRVTSRLLEVRDSHGPAGYTGFVSSTGRHGVILGGYSTGVKPGVCFLNGQRRIIVESGMQTSFVEVGPADRAGDEVVLLGDELPIEDVARAVKSSPHEALWRLSSNGARSLK